MRLLRQLRDDTRFALRVMRKAPLATATIVICLGFSIGATATVYAWMEGIVLRPIRAVPDVDRIVSLKSLTPTSRGSGFNLSYPAYRDMRRDHARAGDPFAQLAGFALRRFKLATARGSNDVERQAEPTWGMLVSANYFDVLCVRPILGRGFVRTEDSVAGREPVAVISHALWQRRFASDPAVLGRHVAINGQEFSIIGVAPPRFAGTISGLAFDLWIPITMRSAIEGQSTILEDRTVRWVNVFARLPDGVSLEQAAAAARPIGAAFAEVHPEDREHTLTARRLDIGPGASLEPILTIMLAITVLVLVLVCTNVANLLLLRGATRQHEIAVRMALGAQSRRVVVQLLTESLILAIAGILLGVVIAQVGSGTFSRNMPDTPLPAGIDTSLSMRVVAVLAGVGLLTVLFFGLVPALRTVRHAMSVSLSSGGSRGTTSRGAGIREALVGAQFALSLAVLIVAMLFVRRLDELKQIDRGFREPEHVLVATVDFGLAGLRGDAAFTETSERLLERLRTITEARSTALATFVPLGFLGYSSMAVSVDGYVPQRGEDTTYFVNRVTDGYFGTMGIPVLRGRAIGAQDRGSTADRRVAVVNEAFAERYWKNEDPIGRVIKANGREVTIVGVVRNGKYYFMTPLDEPSPPFVYVPLSQWPSAIVVVHARATGNPMQLMSAIRREVTATNPELSVLSPTTLERHSAAPLMPIRVGAGLLTVLGGAALLLAALGLYAVIGYAVTQRQREIGVRMALGATPGRVVRTFVAEAGRYAGVGAVAGLLVALGVIAGIQGYFAYILPQGSEARVAAAGLALFVLAGVALFAAILPARRATRVDPTTALRAE